MDLQYIAQSIMTDIYNRYTTTPYKLNDSDLYVDPADSYKGKTLDQINDCIVVGVFPLSSDREILNAQLSGRWVRGRVRVNVYDKKVTGDTTTGPARCDQLLGIIDALWSEKEVTDANVKIRFDPMINITDLGENTDFQRHEKFAWFPFRALFL